MNSPVPQRPDRPRHRDRHGRGMRGPIAPPQVPLALTRAQAFDDLVRESAERLGRRWPQLTKVEFTVQDIPREEEYASDPVPLGRVTTVRGKPGSPDVRGEGGADGGLQEEGKHRIVVYRRPVEIRAKSNEERAALVHEVVVEQVAELLGLAPETVDPQYGRD